jgi:hypothetical protein
MAVTEHQRPFQADGSGIDFMPPLSTRLPESAPVVVICYGTAGSSSESYVQQLANAVCRSWADGGLGGRVAIVNVGCASSCALNLAENSFAAARLFP